MGMIRRFGCEVANVISRLKHQTLDTCKQYNICMFLRWYACHSEKLKATTTSLLIVPRCFLSQISAEGAITTYWLAIERTLSTQGERTSSWNCGNGNHAWTRSFAREMWSTIRHPSSCKTLKGLHFPNAEKRIQTIDFPITVTLDKFLFYRYNRKRIVRKCKAVHWSTEKQAGD